MPGSVKGHRSAADWIAAATGSHISDAVEMLQTARRLEELPLIRGAFRAGELSEEQARVISEAAYADPRRERELIAAAHAETVKTLRVECKRVKNAAAADERARLEAIQRRRYMTSWVEADGAVRIDARLTPLDGAEVLAAVEQAKNKIFQTARREERRESSGAYMADALVQLVTSGAAGGDTASGPRAMVNVFVDHQALTSGIASAGDVCEIEGIGPVPAATAQALLSDSILKVVVTDGVDVRAVSKTTRTIPARVRTAILARDRTCVVPRCDQTRRLEIDHIKPIAERGPTELANLARLCRTHHFQKTTLGYRLSGTPGNWTWETPSDQEGARPPPEP